jgi:hypothetical protein
MNAPSTSSNSNAAALRRTGLVAAAVAVGLVVIWQLRRAPPPETPAPEPSDRSSAVAPAPITPGDARPAPPAPPSVEPRPAPETTDGAPSIIGFRLTAIIAQGEQEASVGIVDRDSGQSRTLRAGDETRDGWRLVRILAGNEAAVFQRGSVERTVRLSEGEDAPEAEIAAGPGPEELEGDAAPAPPPVPFSELVVEISELGAVTASVYPANPDWVQLSAREQRFAVRKEIATNIMNIPGLDAEQKMRMLLTHPAAAEVQPGADLVEAATAAEKNLQDILSSPPTETPPVEELVRLVEELKAADAQKPPEAEGE